MSTKHEERASKIIKSIIYATVATASKEGQPWNSPVRHVYDNQLNIYWFSDKEGQHSKNIRDNNDVFIVIYDSTVREGDGEGVYIKAKAYELNELEQIRHARRIKKGTEMDDSDSFIGDAIRRVYKAIPEKIWINDDATENGIFIKDLRIEMSLEDVVQQINS